MTGTSSITLDQQTDMSYCCSIAKRRSCIALAERSVTVFIQIKSMDDDEQEDVEYTWTNYGHSFSEYIRCRSPGVLQLQLALVHKCDLLSDLGCDCLCWLD